MNDFINLLKAHEEREEKRLNIFENKLDVIKDNHLTHIESSMSGLMVISASHGKDIEWLKWIVLTVLGVSIAGLVAAILNLVFN